MAISFYPHARVAELADAQDLGSCTERCTGSTPVSRTNVKPFRSEAEGLFLGGFDIFNGSSARNAGTSLQVDLQSIMTNAWKSLTSVYHFLTSKNQLLT